MNTEMKVLSCLYSYGNARENDLIDYGVRRPSNSEGIMKETLDIMTKLEGAKGLCTTELNRKWFPLTLDSS